MNIQELARTLGATVDAEADVEITGIGTIDGAGPAELTFLANERYTNQLATSRAGAVLVEPAFDGESAPTPLRVDNPYLAFARAIDLFYAPPAVPTGVHPTAVLGERVVLGDGVGVGAYAVIGDDVTIGDGTTIHPHVVVYAGAAIGPECVLHSHAVVREHVRLGGGVILQNGAVVGADGFGFAPRGDGTYEKMTQAGTVELADEVEVQANACVDRATVGTTTIGRGTRIDNLVQVGHGCQVGENTLLCGQTGLAGSTIVGDRVVMAGQVGIAGHCRIGDDVILAAQSAASTDVTEPGVYGGAPALPVKEWRQVLVRHQQLPRLARTLKDLGKRIARLEAAE